MNFQTCVLSFLCRKILFTVIFCIMKGFVMYVKSGKTYPAEATACEQFSCIVCDLNKNKLKILNFNGNRLIDRCIHLPNE